MIQRPDFKTAVLAVATGAALALVGSCQAYDEELYKNAESGGASSGGGASGAGGTAGAGGSTGGASGAAGTGGGNWSAIVDSCPVPKEKVVNSAIQTHTGTYKLNQLADNIQSCHKLSAFDGPDGVLGFELAGGQRVALDAQFVVAAGQSAPPVDLGLCIMGSCDPQTGNARVDRCPPGAGEELYISTANSGTFYLDIDSKKYDTAKLDPEVRVTVTYTVCGNKQIEKGETCDDGNKVIGDGCTDECLKELRDTGIPPTEVEPNNHYIAGNVVIVEPGKTVLVKGSIGGGCDLDFFLLDVPEGAFPRVTMLAADGKDCPAGTPPFPLEFNDPTGTVKLGAAPTPGGCQADAGASGVNCCPKFDENTFAGVKSLPKNRYALELKPFSKGVGNAPFSYVLKIELVPPGSADAGGG